MARVFAGAMLMSTLLGGCGGGAGGESAAPSNASGNTAPSPLAAFTLEDVEASPYAIWDDELGTRPITIRARTTQATGDVALRLAYFDALVGGSGAQIVEPMYDDGTHGDAVAHDGTWTLTFVPALATPGALRLYDSQIDSISIAISAASGATPVAPSNAIDARIDVAIVARALDGAFAVHRVDANTQATDTMVNLVDPDFDGARLENVLNRLYAIVRSDPFDFAVLFHTRTNGDGVPRSIGVANDVDGINVARFDRSASWGSAGRLQQVVFQNAHMLGLEINHEIGHRWAAYLNRDALNLARPTGFHWGASNHVGQMGNGPYLLEEGDGYRVTNAADSENFVVNAFSPLELYLMGLARADEVEPVALRHRPRRAGRIRYPHPGGSHP